jgi:hypothetical protein
MAFSFISLISLNVSIDTNRHSRRAYPDIFSVFGGNEAVKEVLEEASMRPGNIQIQNQRTPVGKTGVLFWWAVLESNQQPTD